MDLSAREGIYTQSESESRKKARIVDLNVRKGENGVKEWLELHEMERHTTCGLKMGKDGVDSMRKGIRTDCDTKAE